MYNYEYQPIFMTVWIITLYLHLKFSSYFENSNLYNNPMSYIFILVLLLHLPPLTYIEEIRSKRYSPVTKQINTN